MKKLILTAASIAMVLGAHAQIPNTGFETLDTLGQPQFWRAGVQIVMPIDSNCTWADVDSMARTTSDAHTGNYAYRLGVASYCPDNRFGGSTKANRYGFDTFADQRIIFTERAAAFTFYYKFTPVMNDFVRVEAILESDPAGTIADGLLEIRQAANGWIQGSIPMNYYLPDTPALLSLKFTVATDSVVHMGTRFVLDDINYTPANVGVADLNPVQHLQCYPVPSGDVLYIRHNAVFNTAIADLSITDMTGRMIRQQKVATTAKQDLQIPVADLPQGVYYISLSAAGQKMDGRFVK